MNEVGFEDGAGGESQVVGTFVSNTSKPGFSASARTGALQTARVINDAQESREARAQKARKKLQQVCQ